ncbi:MAG: NADH-quinone oxidoreductase subunit L, partial [Bdellovibrionales bacterium]|nr:NADH-quinone oxidoreductase subunit L [Bdellovibrionales bacterium]
LVITTQTLSFPELQAAVPGLSQPLIEVIALLLFVGAVGKSAQIPLFVWLPDAMAGPTPVSALIHAATMVTAGVYMLARMSFLYAFAPAALSVVLIVGTGTAFLAATIALVQNDIKKVLAYSTVSQLGYMFMAAGSGAFSNGIYHVVTHAFFKACLFMAAGSVIIGCHHEQDMRRFGGLWKKMPLTFLAYLVATLAIAGFPGLSGFFSKDAILWTTFHVPEEAGLRANQIVLFGGVTLNRLCWAVGLFTAFLTAFYMTRSLVLTFFGSYRGHHEPHESPWVVTVPLIILAVLSAGFGALYGHHLIEYLAPWTRPDMLVDHEVLAHQPYYHLLEYLSIGAAVGGILLAVALYTWLPKLPALFASVGAPLYRALSHKWWVDEAYDAAVVRPLRALAGALFRGIDRFLIDDAIVNGSAMFVESNGEAVRRMHTGRTSSYVFAMFVSVLVVVGLYLFGAKGV